MAEGRSTTVDPTADLLHWTDEIRSELAEWERSRRVHEEGQRRLVNSAHKLAHLGRTSHDFLYEKTLRFQATVKRLGGPYDAELVKTLASLLEEIADTTPVPVRSRVNFRASRRPALKPGSVDEQHIVYYQIGGLDCAMRGRLLFNVFPAHASAKYSPHRGDAPLHTFPARKSSLLPDHPIGLMVVRCIDERQTVGLFYDRVVSIESYESRTAERILPLKKGHPMIHGQLSRRGKHYNTLAMLRPVTRQKESQRGH